MQKFLLFIFSITLFACNNKFLEKPADSSQVPPSTVDGYQTLLDNELMTSRVTPCVESFCTDDFILNGSLLGTPYWGLYTWNPSFYQNSGFTENSWDNPYKAINYANVTLAGLPKLPPAELAKTKAYNWVYGSALFLRAFHYFFLEETFGHPYNPNTASGSSGVVLRLGIDPEERMGRSSVLEVYTQIMRDLRGAVSLLPGTVQRDRTNRPSLPAAYAMLARVCLVMKDFHAAQSYADSCLLLTDSLLRYDTVSLAKSKIFDAFNNSEVLFQCSGIDCPTLFGPSVSIDNALYSSYDGNDLRRTLFFQPNSTGDGVSFRGYYSTGRLTFSGLALDEVLLTRAECRARNKDVLGAMEDLNKLLSTRWRPGTYHNYQATTPAMALDIVLQERRKELVGRELRFVDMRRLLDEPSAVTVRRATGDSLIPGGGGYTLQIPALEIELGGISQN